MLAGSNPGADVVNFRFHITGNDHASLQPSSVVSVENDQTMSGGNNGAIVTEKTNQKEIEWADMDFGYKGDSKCGICGAIEKDDEWFWDENG
jgi:hypothetical protein